MPLAKSDPRPNDGKRLTYPRVCRKCGIAKEKIDFYALGGKNKGRGITTSRCIPCARADFNVRRKKWASANPSLAKKSARRSELKRLYGISLEQYHQVILEQGGGCAICHSSFDGHRGKSKKAPHVDHDHVTGKVRSVLCGACNVGLGSFNDSPSLLLAAADYVFGHGGNKE